MDGYKELSRRKIAFVSTSSLFCKKMSNTNLRLKGVIDNENYNLPLTTENRHDMTLFWAKLGGESASNRKNVVTRFERPARTVIYAVFAYWNTILHIRTAASEFGDSEAERLILNDAESLCRVVEWSETCRPIAASISSMKVSDAEQIKFVVS